MVNPFISIDEQLKRIGWNKYYECDLGFKYVRKIGVDVYHIAHFDRYHIDFSDEGRPIGVSEITLELFPAKKKEWRRQYGRNTESGRHTDKECS